MSALGRERMCADGKEQAGIWASAFRQLDIANMIGLLFASMLMPMYGKLIANKQPVEHIVKLSVNLLLPISVAVSTVAVMYSDPIMSLLYHLCAYFCTTHRLISCMVFDVYLL